jgi:hypothetical protein
MQQTLKLKDKNRKNFVLRGKIMVGLTPGHTFHIKTKKYFCQTVEYVCIDNMKMDGNFDQTSVSATCLTDNKFEVPNPWPICKPSKN